MEKKNITRRIFPSIPSFHMFFFLEEELLFLKHVFYIQAHNSQGLEIKEE